MDTFLRLNGYSLTLSDKRLFDLVIRVASGRLDKDGLIDTIRSMVEHVH